LCAWWSWWRVWTNQDLTLWLLRHFDIWSTLTWTMRYLNWKFWVQGHVVCTFISIFLHQTKYDLLKNFNIEPWLWQRFFTKYSMKHEILKMKILSPGSCSTYLHFKFFASNQIMLSCKIYLQIPSLLFNRIS